MCQPTAGATLRGIAVMFSLLCAASPEAQHQTAVEVNLGFDVTTPGGEVFLPLTLVSTGDSKVAKIVSEIRFPSAVVTFSAIRPGTASEQVHAEVTAGKVTTDGKGVSTVTVVVSAKKPLPAGVIANLTFVASKDAPQVITSLDHALKAMSVDGTAIGAARGGPGELTIAAAPVSTIACFFYMH